MQVTLNMTTVVVTAIICLTLITLCKTGSKDSGKGDEKNE